MKGWLGLWSRREAEEREWCEAGASYILELIISPGIQGGVSLKDARMIEIGKACRPSWAVWKKADNVLAEEQLETTIVPVSGMTGLPLLEGYWDGHVRTLSEGPKGQEEAREETIASCLAEPQVSCSFLAFAFCLMEWILALLHARPSLHHRVIFWSRGRALVCIVDCEDTESWKRMQKGRWQNSRASQWRSLFLL